MKKQTKAILISAFLSLPLLTSCGRSSHSYSESRPSSNSSVPFHNGDKINPIKIFDYFLDDGYPSEYSFNLKEFSSEPFSLNARREIISPGGETVIKADNALFVYDVNDDGYRDFCITQQAPTSVYRTYIKVYDYKNDKLILNTEKRDSKFNYFFEIYEDKLCVFKTHDRYFDTRYGRGVIEYKNSEVDIKWTNYFEIDRLDLSFTYADPTHRVINPLIQGDAYTYQVDEVSTFILNITPIKTGGKVMPIPNDFYGPVSFTINGQGIKMTNPINDKPFTYALTFKDLINGASIEIEFSGFKKKLVFNLSDNANPFTLMTIADLISWPKNEQVNISEISIAEEKPDTLTDDEHRGIGTILKYNSPENLAAVQLYFDEPLFQVDPEDFINDYMLKNIFKIKTDKGDYSLEFIGSLLCVDNKYYPVKKFMSFGAAEADMSANYFDHTVDKIVATSLIDNTLTKTINNPGDILFTSKNNNEYTIRDAHYSFEIRGSRYYIIENKKFIDSKAYYLFEVISDKDFSELF